MVREHLVLTKNLIPHNLVLATQKGRLTIKIIDGLRVSGILSRFQVTQIFLLKDMLIEELNLCGAELIGIFLVEKETGNNLNYIYSSRNFFNDLIY